jgi:hypothetical protein
MPSQTHKAIGRLCRTRMLLPIVMVIVFLGMVSVAEYQIRSSPKWPPPPRHEVGGWQIDDPPLWTWAAGLNLPATLPILMMSAASDRFTYALDDHQLIVYVPWIFFVFLLWYFVAYHFDRFASGRATRRYVIFVAQIVITAELIYCGIGIFDRSSVKPPTVVAVCFWVWLVVTLVGWINLVRPARVQR